MKLTDFEQKELNKIIRSMETLQSGCTYSFNELTAAAGYAAVPRIAIKLREMVNNGKLTSWVMAGKDKRSCQGYLKR